MIYPSNILDFSLNKLIFKISAPFEISKIISGMS
tara:strand:- start:279 stop:380 length:102 start_codon:yes stop_codon:yes gene_type:complete